MAAKRLKQLVQDGLLAQQPYREPGARTRYEYVLTDRAGSCSRCSSRWPNWGLQFGSGHGSGHGAGHDSDHGSDYGSVEFVHAGCGARLTVAVRCEACRRRGARPGRSPGDHCVQPP